MFFRCAAAALTATVFVSWSSTLVGVDAFLYSQRTGWISPRCTVSRTQQHVSLDNRVETKSVEDDHYFSDEELLREVSQSQLADLCTQYNLTSKGSKIQLLKRLRDHANEQAEMEQKRRRGRIARVEEGGQDGKERHEIVNDHPDNDDDDEGYFYFHVPTNETETKPMAKKPIYVTNSVITAPPPPPVEPDKNGERVVTVYSTKDQNDLTGVAAAQPGQNPLSNDAMMAGSSESSAPWDMADSHRTAEASSKELEEANEAVAELVHALLSMTGAPAFREEFSGGLQPVANGRERRSSSEPQGFMGFDPAEVPTDLLIASSKALRAGRGQVLQAVLRDYELRAVGHDGMAGDDIEKGGGHYREVSKVGAFLEGYRQAEVRHVARETTCVLLDKLVSEGIEGLDFLLASMAKSSDDTGDAGELNDSLLNYLNDAIRQQEKKIKQTIGSDQIRVSGGASPESDEDDHIEELWNVTTEDGSRVETLDPNDPRVQKALRDEASKSETGMLGMARSTPESASEQLLLLLTLLRERIKVEAAFANDEKGRNLRILAYCLQVATNKDREEIVRQRTGSSVDRLDSFMELVRSSIEYAESTSHQLQPSRSRPLNVKLLKSILELAQDLRAYQASGALRKQ